MEARLGYTDYEMFDNIIQLLAELEMEDAYETVKTLPEEFQAEAQDFVEELNECNENWKDYKCENREEHFTKFIAQVKLNHRYLLGWREVLEEIGRGYHKMKRKRERQAKSFYNLKTSRSEEVEEVDLTDMEEYDLTGTGEPVYETPIMTPQLCRRIMANEFSQDQVEYIIKKSLKF